MKPLVLVNAAAGAAAQYPDGELARAVERAFVDAGTTVDVRSASPRNFKKELEAALRTDRPVIIGGGDGSVSAAVQLFAGTGVPLGVLPFGTYNLLGRDIGVSTDLAEAARQLAGASERDVDVGQIGDRYFHTLAGLGFFSRAARQRAEIRKSVSSKIVGAAIAAVRSFTQGGSLDVLVETAAAAEEFRTPAILITNNLMDAATWRRPRLDAGLFEINVVRGDIPFPLLRGGFAAMTGGWRESGDIVTWTAPEVTLRLRRPRVFLSLDGEVRRPRTPLTFRVAPGALRVLAPRETSEAATPASGESVAPGP